MSRPERKTVDPEEFPKSWFIGDGVISRYGVDQHVRITPTIPEPGVRQYRVVLLSRPSRDGDTGKHAFRSTLIEALHLGEAWLP